MPKMPNPPRQFDDMVSEVAGMCLLRLVKGDGWYNIFHLAAIHIIQWADQDRQELDRINK